MKLIPERAESLDIGYEWTELIWPVNNGFMVVTYPDRATKTVKFFPYESDGISGANWNAEEMTKMAKDSQDRFKGITHPERKKK